MTLINGLIRWNGRYPQLGRSFSLSTTRWKQVNTVRDRIWAHHRVLKWIKLEATADDKFLYCLSQSGSGTLLLAAQSILSTTHWNHHSSGQMQDLFAVQILSRRRFFTSQNLFKLTLFYDMKKPVPGHKILTLAKSTNRALRLDFNTTDPLHFEITLSTQR